jgi:hypothetical protein
MRIMQLPRPVLLLALSASVAGAQPPVARPVGAVRPAVGGVSAVPAGRALAAMPASRAGRAGIGALAGGVLGATIGALLAAERVHRPSVTDHSEDGLVYFVFVGGGAVVGLVAGTAVGLVWPQGAGIAAARRASPCVV